MLLSLLLLENPKNKISSAVFLLINKTDFKITSYRSNYDADLTSMKICYTEVNLSVGAMVHIHDYLHPWHLFKVTEGIPKGSKRGVLTGSRCVLTEQNCDLKTFLTCTKSSGS